MTTATRRRTRASSAPEPVRTYRWRGGGGFRNVPADVVGAELERLEIRPGDHHKTVDVLNSASDPDSPLHGCFEWDDTKAAALHRMQTCRSMLRSIAVVIVHDNKQTKRPVYVHITDDEGPKYIRTERVVNDAEVRRKALDEALALLSGVRRRFEFIQELSEVFEAIDRIAGQAQSRP